MMKVKIKEKHGEIYITGEVNNIEVIEIVIHSNRRPTVSTSINLPVDVNSAEEYVRCFKMTFDKFRSIEKEIGDNEE